MSGEPAGWLERRGRELVLAVMMLTRVPMPALATVGDEEVRRRVWAYPLVGAGIGAVGGAVYLAADAIGLPAPPAAILSVAATVLLTGCFHEDAIGDFWDGIGGGRTKERKLEIMRDSRIGSYGAAALFLTLALRVAAVAALAEPMQVLLALVAGHAMARGLIAVLFLTLEPARKEGLAAAGDGPPPAVSLVALALASVLAYLLLPAAAATVAMLAALAGIAVMGWLMQRQIGGYTGDALGASEQVAEVAVLLALLALVD